MEYGEALSAIEASELPNKAELIAAIKGQVQTVLGQKHRTGTRVSELEATLSEVLEALGVEGETAEERIAGAKGKASSLRSEVERLAKELNGAKNATEAEKTALQTKLDQAVASLEKIQKGSLLTEAASKAGANPDVLKQLAELHKLDIEIDGDEVRVKTGEGESAKTQPLKEFIEASEQLKAFSPALFLSDPAPRKPSAPPGKSGSAANESVAKSYLSKKYALPKQGG